MQPEIKKTDDGSSTLYLKELDETYHSINGAVQESMHVFIGKGLKTIEKEDVNILEMGFGTGLNAILSLLNKGEQQIINYEAIEKYPLSWELVYDLEYCQHLNLTKETEEQFRHIHQGEWERVLAISGEFKLLKRKGSIHDLITDKSYDLVYFDAFAPAVQPDLWTDEVFTKMYSCMSNGAILVTYCAKGEVRRSMMRAGFAVERLQGPPGKREMLRAKK